MAPARQISTSVLWGFLGTGAALGLGVFAYRTAHVQLPMAARTAIARRLGLPLSAVALRSARLTFHGLELDEVAAGQLGARRIVFRPALRSLWSDTSAATIEMRGLVLEDPPIDAVDRVLVEEVRVELSADQIRAQARKVRVELGGDEGEELAAFRLANVAAELSRGPQSTLRRAAFTGLQLGPFAELAGAIHRREEGLELRAAGEGAQLTAHLSNEGADGTLALDHRNLRWDEGAVPWLTRLGVPSGELSVSGRITAQVPRGGSPGVGHVAAQLDLDRAELKAPRMAAAPLSLPGTQIALHAELGAQLASTLRVSRGPIAIELAARIDGDEAEDDEGGRSLAVDATLPRSSCPALLSALPAASRPALDGIELDGQIGGRLHVSVPLDAPRELTLDGSLDNACRVHSEPPLADAARLRTEAPILAGARDDKGQPRRFVLGPANPSFRRLDQIPAAVVETFIEAEDARFFQHRGLDLAQVRRALGHDLEVGAPGRGGSTITQQLAKNLFLSGDRTLSRKLEEVVLAWRLEEQLGKKRILELYLNLVELGPGVYGLAEGARHWMGKDLAALTANDAAKLAALLPAPRRGMDEAWRRRYALLRARLPQHGRAQVSASDKGPDAD